MNLIVGSFWVEQCTLCLLKLIQSCKRDITFALGIFFLNLTRFLYVLVEADKTDIVVEVVLIVVGVNDEIRRFNDHSRCINIGTSKSDLGTSHSEKQYYN